MKYQTILVTGGAGFIGANFIRMILLDDSFQGTVVNFDALTYAGNPANLAEFADDKRYILKTEDIRDRGAVDAAFEEFDFDCVCHFAAESHVDRSIHSPAEFVETNVLGSFNLLDAARKAWTGKDKTTVRFHHVSTDEVYGSLGDTGKFLETTPYDPRSPYSASKAGSDHLARAYRHTFGLPVTISNCSNNYGPYQFPEKLIPVIVLNAIAGKPLPIYGDGLNVRDWLHVEDHCAAIKAILDKGAPGETYNIGGDCEKTNIELVKTICAILDRLKPRSDGAPYAKQITFVQDRPGHDRRYAIDCEKIKRELGWKQSFEFERGVESTVRWYLDHADWIADIQSGDYQNWMETNYSNR